MRWLAIGGGVLVALILVVVAIGYMLPVKHRASRQAVFRASADDIYRLISAAENFPSWRSKVRTVEREGPARFREIGDDGTILYEVVEQVPSQRLVTRIADPSLPFGGRWTYELSAHEGGQTTLRITEDGEVYNPIFRFVSRYVMGHTATIDQYLRDVGRHLKQEPAIT
jgi:uncharacterized protein YndB with AHSA1/START domain